MADDPVRRGFSLAVENLGIGRGGRVLAAGLSFRLEAGQALVVTGPNGAGKSTLLRTLAGLLPALGGRVRADGPGIDGDGPPGLAAHYVGHADGLKNALSVAENLEFWAAMLAAGRAESRVNKTCKDALRVLGLPHVIDFPAGYLSAGQRRRVALARLLVAFRPLWLLDEPATALDAASQETLAQLMHAHLGEGGIVIAATHAQLGLEHAKELRLGTVQAAGEAQA